MKKHRKEINAEIRKKTAATISRLFLPKISANFPAKKAPMAQPNSIDATLKPVPASSALNADCSPSMVPLITPLSKPNKKPPIVAIKLTRIIVNRFSLVFACCTNFLLVVFIHTFHEGKVELTFSFLLNLQRSIRE